MSQENLVDEPLEEYMKNYRAAIEDDGADYASLRTAELAHLTDHDMPLAIAMTKLLTKHGLDDRGAYLRLNSASNAYLFFNNFDEILTHQEKKMLTYLYDTEVASWPEIKPEIVDSVRSQLKATFGNPNIWRVENDDDPEGLLRDIDAAWDDLIDLTCAIWDGAHDEWADTSDVSGVELSLKHGLFTSCPRSSYQEAMRWVAHQPENQGPARDFVYLMMGVFELAWVDFLKHR